MVIPIAAPYQGTRPESVPALDEAAFGEFFRQDARGLWAYVYRVTGNAGDADDIVQEAFCRVLCAGPPGGREEWRRYLYRVASNLVVDRWRAGRRAEQRPPWPRQPWVGPPSEGDEDVARRFGQLGQRDRSLLWLAYVEEETHEEIADSLGLRRGSIKVLLYRAKRRLRELLTR